MMVKHACCYAEIWAPLVLKVQTESTLKLEQSKLAAKTDVKVSLIEDLRVLSLSLLPIPLPIFSRL